MNPRVRQFVAGDAGIAGGINWRVVLGTKFPGDLVIEWYIGERWVPVSMDTVFVAVDLICQNEDRRYPYPAKGGQMTIDALREARTKGYEHAIGYLHLQREHAEQKRRAADFIYEPRRT